jgi:hypothetical protein
MGFLISSHGNNRAGYEMARSVSGRELLQVGRRQSSFRNSPNALLVASKRPGRQAAVFAHHVPARLDAADVRFIFIDVKRNGQCVAPRLAVKALLAHWAAVLGSINFAALLCDQAALLNALDTPVLMGSAVSAATC